MSKEILAALILVAFFAALLFVAVMCSGPGPGPGPETTTQPPPHPTTEKTTTSELPDTGGIAAYRV
jgi:hypothetical protein